LMLAGLLYLGAEQVLCRGRAGAEERSRKQGYESVSLQSQHGHSGALTFPENLC
jgi:hypothetical protein